MFFYFLRLRKQSKNVNWFNIANFIEKLVIPNTQTLTLLADERAFAVDPKDMVDWGGEDEEEGRLVGELEERLARAEEEGMMVEVDDGLVVEEEKGLVVDVEVKLVGEEE